MGKDIILSVRDLMKTFGGIKALNHASFDVERGTIHALVGENGAGKSTLIKILTGIYHSDGGCFHFDGSEKHYKNPLESRLDGISVVHQDFQVAEPLSIVENMYIGRMLYKRNGMIDWKLMRKNAKELLDRFHLDFDVNDRVSTLTVAQKQILEICKAVLWDCKLLLLDEPSATLTNREIDFMFEMVRNLREQGITVIYISHRLEEVFAIADNVTVLCDGRVVGTNAIHELNRNKLISMMVGHDLEHEYPKEEVEIGEVSLSVKNLNSGKRVHNVSFEARKGEILGFSGLVGAGRTEIANAILGIDKRDSGEIYLNGKEIRNKNFEEAIRNGFGLIPEDRKTQGLVMSFTIRENVTMVAVDQITRSGIINKKKQQALADEYVEKLKVATDSIEKEARFLSGGNQQKIVIAKWLMQNCDVIFLDEPTRGVDVGAKAEIYKLIGQMAKEGKTVIVISSDLPEILGICDRILVVNQGTIAANIMREDASQEKILSYCV